MMNDYIYFCPYCGEVYIKRYMDGKCQCEKCNAIFYVMEHENSEREVENE